MENAKNIVNVSGACFDYVRVYSDGLWNVKPGESILQHSLVRFHVQLVVMFIISNSLHYFLKRFHFPAITSQFLTGIILGRSFLGTYFTSEADLIFPSFPNQVLVTLAKIGLIMFLFLAAARMDPRLIKISSLKAFVLGIVLFVVPRSMIQTIDIKVDQQSGLTSSMEITALINSRTYFNAIAGTQFVGVSILLMEQKIVNSRLGHLALAASLLAEILKFSFATGLQLFFFSTEISATVAIQSAMLILCLVMFIVVIIRSVIHIMIKRTPVGKPIKDIYTTIVVVMVFVVASLGDTTGADYQFGPLVLGLIVPAGSPLAESLVKKIETIVSGLLLPILIMFCATKFNLWEFFTNFGKLYHVHITLVAYAIKLLITFITAICLKVPIIDAVPLSMMLNVKSVVELGLFLSYTNIQAEGIETTSGMFVVFLLATIIPVLVKFLYDPEKQYIGHRKKSIQHATPDSELQILVCAHRQEDAMAAIKLLEYTNPTKHTPLSVYGLCLEELLSSLTPLLINHQLGQKISSSEGSRSQPMIDIFKYFETQNKKSAEVHIFTAISPVAQMHEDICYLAFDRGASMIVLPFHKKWNSKGKLVSSSDELRRLNISVLDRAPCSVGILVDRGRNRGLSSIFTASSVIRVAALFVGGPDDREALAYALRMAGSPRVQLYVYHLSSPFDVHDNWERMLNVESLKHLKVQMSSSNNIAYVDETVRDGGDTAALVISMQENYDLIIVGRRHENEAEEAGLSHWTELPELGPIGDLLASDSDISSAVSVLVVQQQIMMQSHSSILN